MDTTIHKEEAERIARKLANFIHNYDLDESVVLQYFSNCCMADEILNRNMEADNVYLLENIKSKTHTVIECNILNHKRALDYFKEHMDDISLEDLEQIVNNKRYVKS